MRRASQALFGSRKNPAAADQSLPPSPSQDTVVSSVLHVDVHGATGVASGMVLGQVKIQVDDQTLFTRLANKAAADGTLTSEETSVFRKPSEGFSQLVMTVWPSADAVPVELKLNLHGILAYENSRSLELSLDPVPGILHVTVGWATPNAVTR